MGWSNSRFCWGNWWKAWWSLSPIVRFSHKLWLLSLFGWVHGGYQTRTALMKLIWLTDLSGGVASRPALPPGVVDHANDLLSITRSVSHAARLLTYLSMVSRKGGQKLVWNAARAQMCLSTNSCPPGRFLSCHFDLAFQISVSWRDRESCSVSKDWFSVHAYSGFVDTFLCGSLDTVDMST